MNDAQVHRMSSIASCLLLWLVCYCYIAGVVRKVPRCVIYGKQGRTIRVSGPVQFPEVGGPYAMKRADLELAMKHMDLITM